VKARTSAEHRGPMPDLQGSPPVVNVLYVFTGAPRKADVRHYLDLCPHFHFAITEVDILRP